MPKFRFPFTKAGVTKIVFSNVAAPTPDILWWKMNDGSGTTVTATVGVNGTISGGTTWSDGGLDFDGIDGTLSSNSTITIGTKTITVSFWVQAAAWDATQEMIFADSGGIAYADCLITGNRVNIGLVDAGGQRNEQLQNASSVLTANTWYHFAIIYDNTTASGDITLYINGANQTLNIGQNNKTGTSNFDANTWRVGWNGTDSWLDGKLDDFRIYSYGLTNDQVTAIYNAGRQ